MQIALFVHGRPGYDNGRQGKDSAMMNGFDSPNVLWVFIAVQLFGLASAWTARLSEGSTCQSVSQCIFFVALPAIAAITAFALDLGPGFWLISATTMTVMILTVTCDFRASREAATW